MKKYLALIFILFFTEAQAQIPGMPLPELAEGEQLVYLDSMLNTVVKEESYFFMYTFYHLGVDVWSLEHPWRKKSHVLERSERVTSVKGEPVAISGVFKWFTPGYSKLVAEEAFVNGRYSGQTIVMDRKGRQVAVYDYDKKWDRQQWSLYHEEFRKGVLQRASFESYDPDKNKWKTLCTVGCQVSRDFK